MEHVTKTTLLQDGSRSQEIAVPATVLKYRKQASLFQCEFGEFPRFCERDGKGLVDDHILASSQTGRRERKMSLIRTGNDNQVDRGIAHGFLGIRHDACVRQIRQHLVRVARADDRDLQTLNGLD